MNLGFFVFVGRVSRQSSVDKTRTVKSVDFLKSIVHN